MMFAKIFILIAVGISPEGQTLTQQVGSYQTPETCRLAQKDYRVQLQVAKVPNPAVFTLCIQTPWDVPGQKGV